jgi:hypothetical protein
VAIKVGSKACPKDAVRGALEELEKKSADRTGSKPNKTRAC